MAISVRAYQQAKKEFDEDLAKLTEGVVTYAQRKELKEEIDKYNKENKDIANKQRALEAIKLYASHMEDPKMKAEMARELAKIMSARDLTDFDPFSFLEKWEARFPTARDKDGKKPTEILTGMKTISYGEPSPKPTPDQITDPLKALAYAKANMPGVRGFDTQGVPVNVRPLPGTPLIKGPDVTAAPVDQNMRVGNPRPVEVNVKPLPDYSLRVGPTLPQDMQVPQIPMTTENLSEAEPLTRKRVLKPSEILPD